MTWLGASFTLYTLLIVGVGLLAARRQKDSDEDYFLAGRTLGPWLASLSASASTSSGWATMGLVGLGFSSGLRAYWLVPGVLVGIAFNWFVLAARVRDRAADVGAVTLPDLFAMHFGERAPLVRLLSVTVILSAMFLYVAAQLAAAGKAFELAFETVDYRVGVMIGVAVVLAYTVLGGFRAACWTDFIQALLMLGVLIGMPLFLLLGDVGSKDIVERLRLADPALATALPEGSTLAALGFLLGAGALGVNLGYPGQPHAVVRFMALRDRKEVAISGSIAVVWAALVYAGAVTTGLAARLAAGDGAGWALPMLDDPQTGGELALIASAKAVLPGLASGLVLAGILAAIASTADSQLVVAASAAASDVYSRLLDPTGRRAHVAINRATVLVLGVGAALLVVDQDVRIYTFVLTYGWALLGAAFGPQLILLALWRRATYAGCLGGMLTGFGAALVWPHVYEGPIEIYNLSIAFAAALVVNVLLSLATSRR